MRIKISADSACDLPAELLERYQISIFHLTVSYGDVTGLDGVDVVPEDIYRFVNAGGKLPSTAAVNPETYAESFGAWSGEYEAVIHVGLGSGFSSCFQNARIAAAEYPNVYVVDSENLSTGYGHIVLEAAILSQSSMTPQELVGKLTALAPRVSTSFVLGRLDYMRKGGRCSAVEMLGANLLKIKPMIEVRNGRMVMAKKYRGNFEKCLREYVADQLKDREDLVLHRIFITDSGVSDEIRSMVEDEVRSHASFEEVYHNLSGTTISSHCGDNCLGVLFITK